MYSESLRFRFTVLSPYTVKEKVLCKCLTFILHKKPQKLELLCGQIQRTAVSFGSLRCKIHGDISVGKLVYGKPASENALYLGYEYINVVRFFDVVISTEEYAVKLIVLVSSGSKNDYRGIVLFSYFPANSKAVKSGQVYIQQDKPCSVFFIQRQGFFTCCTYAYGIIFDLKKIAQQCT